MQWDYSYFFPSIVTDCHVTNWGDQPLKFRVDVASMGKLGFDIVASHLNEKEMQFCKEAVGNYHSYKDVIWHGDLYRLVNPHENNLSSLMYVNPQKSRAIVFNYLVKVINLFPGTRSRINSEKVYSGDFLMKAGINPAVSMRRTSVALEINEVEQ